MRGKYFLRLLFVFSLLSLLLSISGRLAMAEPPPPLERQIAPLQPANNGRDPEISGEIGAMATAILYPSDDAPVREGAPNATAPNQLYLGVGHDDGYLYGSTGRIRSYLRFDLSSLSGSTVVSATLRIYHAGGQDYAYNPSRTITFYRVTGNWNESSITWNNRPGYAEAVGSVSTTYNLQDWLEVDLTGQVRAWASGSQANYGLVAIGPESIVGIWRALASGESDHSPELHVQYMPAPPPVLDVSPGTLSVLTDSPKQLSVQISNVTANSLSWTATKVGSADWLSLSKTSGSAAPTAPDTLGLTVTPGGRPPGSYTGQVRISSNTTQVQNSPLTVTVTMEVVEHLEQVHLPLIIKGGGGSSGPQVVALVVGIGDYQQLPPATVSSDLPDGWGEEATDLPNPPRDLDDFSRFFAQDLKVPPNAILQYRGASDECVSCVGGYGERDIVQQGCPIATRANIIAAFGQLDGMEDKETVVIFYYSGHGGQTPDGNGDESDGYDEFIAMYDTDLVSDHFINVLTDDDLNALLANLESEHIVVILDSCFSGGMVDVTTMEGSGDLRRRGLGKPIKRSTDSVDGELTAMADLVGPGRVIITGATGDQSTWESNSLQNGVFTYFYLQELKDALCDANQNSRVSAEEAYWFSQDLVDDWVYTNQNEHQNPDISDERSGQVDLTWLP